MTRLFAACALMLTAMPAMAQDYQPRETFAPLDLGQSVNRYRSADGMPGPDYWQNKADYAIRATLDTKAKVLRGSERITYTNNSPDTLRVLWLHLEQNLYKPESRGHMASGGEPRGTTSGDIIDSASITLGKGAAQAVEPLIDDTRMQIRLPAPLKPGESVSIDIAWHFTIPGKFGGRMAWGTSKGGEIYDLAQWYPRMAVYDDIRGWDALPYLAQEFYSEYGDFDYWLTVPSDMIVAGSGELMNPDEVLTGEQVRRLKQAKESDKTVMIRSPQEITDPASRPKRGGTLTWHFRMKDTRDVAWTASNQFAWDAARINLPGGKSALAQSVYPAESAGEDRWGRSTEYVKDTVERFSAKWFPYPWPNAINVAGPATGMEYPGIVFDGIDDKGKDLFWITAHEIGHSWFPMIVGFDERRHAWMDEGFNTFIDVYQSDEFNNGEYGPKRDGEYAPGGGNPVNEILPLLADPQAPPILARADTVIEKYRHPVTYFKSALGLILLREQILGPERFDAAFRRFTAAWAFKHPQPADFFRAMASDAGEDLDYWWRGWYYNNWQMDLAVTGISYVDKDPAKGALVSVTSKDKLVMPATLRVTFADGSVKNIRLPAETWICQATSAVPVGGTAKVVKAEIDPDHKLPDKDRGNNSLSG
ncbi:M1 family metallopeptidase [Stakelama pacifica]|uniref:Peptidase M1-like protein n=1 Tax=Stakelama pacifica TaxID=517720 RepID=A0A4R6FQF2_9SPHN|nr:M1 family metallopeptidase [Stakelama pacifica]TDN83747.1 peptidase M1-like protein [Stakelama pacifica]GGO94711.1 peptidase [Stakelama pacifica]